MYYKGIFRINIKHSNNASKTFVRFHLQLTSSDDPKGNFPNTKLVLQELDIPHFTLDDCSHVQHVCWQVSRRAAFLAATGRSAPAQPW